MANVKDREAKVRTSVLVTSATDQALRRLAKEADRPLSYEIRRALERYVKEETA